MSETRLLLANIDEPNLHTIGVYVGPIALDDVPTLVEQIREGLPPLPGKQLRLRKSTDPGAAR